MYSRIEEMRMLLTPRRVTAHRLLNCPSLITTPDSACFERGPISFDQLIPLRTVITVQFSREAF